MSSAAFASPEIAQFWQYISGSLDRLVELAASLDDEALSWRPPAVDTNSIGILTVHTLGDAEENVLGRSSPVTPSIAIATANSPRDRWRHMSWRSAGRSCARS